MGAKSFVYGRHLATNERTSGEVFETGRTDRVEAMMIDTYRTAGV